MSRLRVNRHRPNKDGKKESFASSLCHNLWWSSYPPTRRKDSFLPVGCRHVERTKEMNRSKRDSNPRYKFVIHSISNRALSATQTLLHKVFKEWNKNWVLSHHYLEIFSCFVFDSVYHTESLLRKREYYTLCNRVGREASLFLSPNTKREGSKTCLFPSPKVRGSSLPFCRRRTGRGVEKRDSK